MPLIYSTNTLKGTESQNIGGLWLLTTMPLRMMIDPTARVPFLTDKGEKGDKGVDTEHQRWSLRRTQA